jgi:hypothetical protein
MRTIEEILRFINSQPKEYYDAQHLERRMQRCDRHHPMMACEIIEFDDAITITTYEDDPNNYYDRVICCELVSLYLNGALVYTDIVRENRSVHEDWKIYEDGPSYDDFDSDDYDWECEQ